MPAAELSASLTARRCAVITPIPIGANVAASRCCTRSLSPAGFSATRSSAPAMTGNARPDGHRSLRPQPQRRSCRAPHFNDCFAAAAHFLEDFSAPPARLQPNVARRNNASANRGDSTSTLTTPVATARQLSTGSIRTGSTARQKRLPIEPRARAGAGVAPSGYWGEFSRPDSGAEADAPDVPGKIRGRISDGAAGSFASACGAGGGCRSGEGS